MEAADVGHDGASQQEQELSRSLATQDLSEEEFHFLDATRIISYSKQRYVIVVSSNIEP